MHFRKANAEFLLPVLLPTLCTISLPSLLLFSPNWPTGPIWSSSQNFPGHFSFKSLIHGVF